MDYRAMFKGDYISAVEFDGRTPTLTIATVKMARLPSLKHEGQEEDKGVIGFKETPRGMVVNRTNAECIAGMFGGNTDGWIGKRITLHAVKVPVGPKEELGIRIMGSPDLERPVNVTVKLARKKPRQMVMAVTKP